MNIVRQTADVMVNLITISNFAALFQTYKAVELNEVSDFKQKLSSFAPDALCSVVPSVTVLVLLSSTHLVSSQF